jgi:hypothetical protein
MKMATWRQLIRATSGHVTDDDRRIERQRQLIEELNRDGRDATAAEQALSVLIKGSELPRQRLQGLIETMPGTAPSAALAGRIQASTHVEKHDV